MPANIYKLKDETRVPGVTTICNQLDKPQLLDWAWKLGKRGIDWREERDSAGDTGTLVHKLILKFLCGEFVDMSLPIYEPVVQGCYNKFLEWWGWEMVQYRPTLITETPLVSEQLKFGGQPDIYVMGLGKKNRLIDIKTSGGIYDSYWYQLAGYAILLKENGYKVDEYQILWLPKDDRFDCPIRTDLRREKKIFKHLLEVYKLRRESGN